VKIKNKKKLKILQRVRILFGGQIEVMTKKMGFIVAVCNAAAFDSKPIGCVVARYQIPRGSAPVVAVH